MSKEQRKIRRQALRDAKNENGAKRKFVRHSGLQLEILQMYRSYMKVAHAKTDAESRENLKGYIRYEFRQNQELPRKLITKIEWHLHMGRTRLEELNKTKPTDKFHMVGPWSN